MASSDTAINRRAASTRLRRGAWRIVVKRRLDLLGDRCRGRRRTDRRGPRRVPSTSSRSAAAAGRRLHHRLQFLHVLGRRSGALPAGQPAARPSMTAVASCGVRLLQSRQRRDDRIGRPALGVMVRDDRHRLPHRAGQPVRDRRAADQFDVVVPRGALGVAPAAEEAVDDDVVLGAAVELQLDARPVVGADDGVGLELVDVEVEQSALGLADLGRRLSVLIQPLRM